MKNTDTPSIEQLKEALAAWGRYDPDISHERVLDQAKELAAAAHAALETLTPSPPLEQPDIEGRARERQAYHDGLCTAARMVRRFMGDQYGENSALVIDVDEGTQADKPTLAYVADALERRALSSTPLPTTEIRREALEEAAREELDCAQIAMGHGKVDVGPIHWQGRTGLLLRPRDAVIPIGDPGEVEGDYWPAQGDVVIWIDDPKGADVIMTELAALASPPSRPSFDKWDYARAVLKDSEGCGG